jgi:hypothetical protein
VDNVQLAELPAAARWDINISSGAMQRVYAPDAKQKTEDIRLLLLVQLANVLVGTHLASWKRKLAAACHTCHRTGRGLIHPLPAPNSSSKPSQKDRWIPLLCMHK